MNSKTSSHPTKPKPKEPLEHEEQVALIKWFRRGAARVELPEQALFSLPNGGPGVKPSGMATLKQEGLLAGAADLFLAVPRFGCGGLFIELKRQKSGRQSADQAAFEAMVKGRGYRYVLAHGAQRAAEAIEAYIGQSFGGPPEV